MLIPSTIIECDSAGGGMTVSISAVIARVYHPIVSSWVDIKCNAHEPGSEYLGLAKFFEIIVLVAVYVILLPSAVVPRLNEIAKLHNDDGCAGDSDNDSINDVVHRYSFLCQKVLRRTLWMRCMWRHVITASIRTMLKFPEANWRGQIPLRPVRTTNLTLVDFCCAVRVLPISDLILSSAVLCWYYVLMYRV